MTKQQTAIMNYIKTHGSITQKEATQIGIYRLSSRISELKKTGVQIEKEMIKVTSRYSGTTYVAKYYVDKTEKP